MYHYKCMNQIAKTGLDEFSRDYAQVEEIEEADALVVRSAALHDTEFPKNLKAIARAGAGVNNIPLGKCAEEGIVVFNTPGANANAVKELVLAGLLLASRDIIGGANWVQSERMNEEISSLTEKQKKQFAGHEIEGKKLGIIGLGAIGVKVANAAVHLGMEVLGYDPYISVEAAWNLSRSIRHITNVDEIYKECDYITVHVPLLDSTRKMINAEAIDKMKDGVVLLNFARDLLVDEDAVGGGGELRAHGGQGAPGIPGVRQYPQFRELSGLRHGHSRVPGPDRRLPQECEKHAEPVYDDSGRGKL